MKHKLESFLILGGSGRRKSKCFIFVQKGIAHQIVDNLREKRKRLPKFWENKTLENQQCFKQ